MHWQYEDQRGAFSKALLELGDERKDVVVLTADLSSSLKTQPFAQKFPDRFFNIGIAEQNMMAIAAGLALCDKIPFATTFAVFGTSRVYDQIRQSIAYPKLNVKIVVSHAGITVGADGASHQMLEDIALMTVLPNFTVIVPADATETYKAVKKAAVYSGPVYIRMARCKVPTVTNEKDNFEIGRATVLKEGCDVTIIATGIMVSDALDAAAILRKENIDACVINISTIKPLDKDTIIKSARETGAVVTAEEHSEINGLGSMVATVLSEEYPVPLKKVAFPDKFGESGEWDELLRKYELAPEKIVKCAKDVIAKKRK